MEILVTGARGFIGSHIAQALINAGHFVMLHSRGLPFNQSDLIVHCAAAAGPWHTLADINRDNVIFTEELIYFANSTYTPIIFTSSIMVYGEPSLEVRPILPTTVNELTPVYSSASYYAKSKYLCEQLLELSSLPYVILRLPGVIGPDANLRNWLPNTARKLLQKEPISVFHPDKPFNNVVHVTDLANFVVHLVKRDFERELFCLATPDTISVESVVHLLATCLHTFNPILNIVTSLRPHFTIDPSLAIRNGYEPMTIARTIRRFAQELLIIRDRNPKPYQGDLL
jgi:nucleoside-diphosphate-sugar epimerase